MAHRGKRSLKIPTFTDSRIFFFFGGGGEGGGSDNVQVSNVLTSEHISRSEKKYIFPGSRNRHYI